MAQPATQTRMPSSGRTRSRICGMTSFSNRSKASSSRKNSVTPISRSLYSRFDLVRILAQSLDVVLQIERLVQLQPPFDAP